MFCPRLGHATDISLEGVLFLHNSVVALDIFVEDKKESSLEIAVPNTLWGSHPFLRIQKNLGLIGNLDATRQTALAITGSVEAKTPTSRKRSPPRKET